MATPTPREVQEDLIDMAQAWADHYSETYAGFKPERHAHYAATLAAARAALAQPDVWILLAKLETYHKDGQCRFGVFGYPGLFETGDSAIRAAMIAAAPKEPT